MGNRNACVYIFIYYNIYYINNYIIIIYLYKYIGHPFLVTHHIKMPISLRNEGLLAFWITLHPARGAHLRLMISPPALKCAYFALRNS